MRLFIAEKPELARAIVAGLGSEFKKKDGYFENCSDVVTWCFGHLLQLADPDDYDPKYKKWNMADLPIITVPWKVKPIPDKKKQLKTISSLIKKADEVVHAGDPDDEGQLLVDEILEYAGCKVPVNRLLINDNNIQVVRKSLSKMSCNSNFRGLYQSALARSVADQLYGYNLSRGYTLAARAKGFDGVLSVGRVQTPILGLVVRRDKAHEAHNKSYYFDVCGDFICSGLSGRYHLVVTSDYPGDDKGRIIDENFAKKVVSDCDGKDASVIQAKTETKEASPPLPYNLLNLQSDAHRKFSIKPDQTLKITQDLREKHQLITYNRSDCQYLSDEQHKEAPGVLEAIAANIVFLKTAVDRVDVSVKSRAFNSKNVSAHHAIIPTARKADITKLSEAEKKIYSIIARAYLAQFYPKQKYDLTKIIIECQGYKFQTSSKLILNPGWSLLYKNDQDNEDIQGESADSSHDLRSLRKGDKAHCEKCFCEKKETKPPARYTLASLMKDLARVSKYVTDPAIKKILLEKDKDKKGEAGGIGTPATRTAIIKTLMDRGFIAEKGKQVISTDIGRRFFEILPEKAVTPDMTALWHQQQKAIQEKTTDLSDFINDISNYISEEVSALKDKGLSIEVNLPECPECKQGFLRRRKGSKGFFWGCTRYPDCKAILSDVKGKPKARAAKPVASDKYLCKTCNKGLIRRQGKKKGSYWWGCSGYPDCKQTYFDQKGSPQYEKAIK